jgi:hypothetical protein
VFDRSASDAEHLKDFLHIAGCCFFRRFVAIVALFDIFSAFVFRTLRQ